MKKDIIISQAQNIRVYLSYKRYGNWEWDSNSPPNHRQATTTITCCCHPEPDSSALGGVILRGSLTNFNSWKKMSQDYYAFIH